MGAGSCLVTFDLHFTKNIVLSASFSHLFKILSYNLHSFALVSPKTITAKKSHIMLLPKVLSLQRDIHSLDGFLFLVLWVREFLSIPPSERLDHPSPGSMCKCGKAAFTLYLQLAFSFQQDGSKRGSLLLCCFSHDHNWLLSCFYSLDMQTLLERWHFTELKFTIQLTSTELTLHSLTGVVALR